MIEKIKSYIFDSKTEDISYYKSKSSYYALIDIDMMIADYLLNHDDRRGKMLLNVYGLLQGLFVGIDALYDLSIGLTKNKYNVNLNANPILKELKYIRNDIVGHPTNRTYPNGGIGFSIISTEKLDKTKIGYETYYYERGNLEVIEREVLIKPLIENYHLEKEKIIDELANYLNSDVKQSRRSNELKTYIEGKEITVEDVANMKKVFINEYNIMPESNNRFFFRFELLELAITWTEKNLDLESLIQYSKQMQIGKLYEMSLEIEGEKKMKTYVPLPSVLKTFYRFARKNESEIMPLLKNVHDLDHPHFAADISGIIAINPPKRVRDIMLFLLDCDDYNKAFLIGGIFKNYRTKKNK